jgi:hypothetical protein
MGLIGRIWRGEEGLARTFWVYGFAVNILLKGLLLLIAFVSSGVPTFGLAVLGVLAFSLVYSIFIWVGIWRSASRYAGPKTWAVLAKIAVVVSIIGTLGSFVGRG